MKTDRTVCIADFGLSITKDEIESKKYPKVQTGTIRYFSPEALKGETAFDVRRFESFTSADVYAYALVFWEALNQSEFNAEAGTFRLPYQEYGVKSDPSIDEMAEVVVAKGLRPKLFDDGDMPDAPISDISTTSTTILRSICEVIRRCWSPQSSDRPSSFQVKDQLNDLFLKLNKV